MELANEVKAAEAEAEKVVSEVKTEIVKVAEEAKVEAVKLVGEVKAEVKKLTQELTSDEKLVIREIENKYLKAQIEITRLSQITSQAQKDFTSTVEGLTKKYAVAPAEWLFDNAELIFKKK